MLKALINNLTLLLSLCIVFRLVLARVATRPILAQILMGVGFGLGTIVGMMNPWEYAPGVIFDGRSVLAGMSGLYGGPVGGLIAVTIGSVFRVAAGGAGAWTGVGVLATSGALGIAYHLLRKRNPQWLNFWGLYLFGVVLHAAMVLWMFTLPDAIAWHVVRQIVLPVMLFFPVATLLSGVLFADQEARQLAQEHLRRSEQRVRSTFDAAPFPIAVSSRADGSILFCNPAFHELFVSPNDDPIGRSVALIYADPADRNQMLAALGSGDATYRMESRMALRDGGEIWALLSFQGMQFEGQPAIFGALMDISERKRLQEQKLALESQLRHQQRLEGIGTLASGVAHEINNPLNGVLNYAQLILDRALPDSPEAGFAQEIIAESERMATIVANLLTFARQEKHSYSPARLVDIIESTLSLIRAVMRNDQISLHIDVPDDLPKLQCRSQQIQQVLLNLMTNARDALNDRYDGFHENKVLTVRAVEHALGGVAGLRLTVADQGVGLTDDVREQMFDPFFTTKGRDKGTGIGLAVTHGIVTDHQGTIEVESPDGGGTEVHVFLPLVQLPRK